MKNRDETTTRDLQFNTDGLIPAIIQSADDKSVLMFAWMNAEALKLTEETGFIHFYSRSRKSIWKKGETSGETFKVASIKVDCDQDCLLVTVTAQGSGCACHTGRANCFYRELQPAELKFEK